MPKYRTKIKVEKETHRIFGINGVIALLSSNQNYNIETIDVL